MTTEEDMYVCMYDGRHGRSPRARLRLREARFFYLQIRLVLQFLSAQTKNYTTLKR